MTAGTAPLNDLNWFNALFGIDAIGPTNGVFINRLPLINGQGLRVPFDQMSIGIGNTAVHEAGHSLGLVPNGTSASRKTFFKDERFGTLSFDGDSEHHAKKRDSNIMSPETSSGPISNTPTVLTTTPEFRAVERAYLQKILPR